MPAEYRVRYEAIANFGKAARDAKRMKRSLEELGDVQADNQTQAEVGNKRVAAATNLLDRSQQKADKSQTRLSTSQQRGAVILGNMADTIDRVNDGLDDHTEATKRSRKETEKHKKVIDDTDRSTRRWRRSLGDLKSPLRDTAQGARDFGVILRLFKIPVIIAGVHLLTGAISALGAGLYALTAALGPAVGIIAAAPTAITALIASIGGLVAAFAGLGEAIKAQNELMRADEPTEVVAANEKLQKSYESLSPAAQRFAETLVSMRPVLDAIRARAQSAALPGFQKALTSLRPLLPVISGGIERYAGAIAQATNQGAQMMSTRFFRGEFDRLLSDNIGNTQKWTRAMFNFAKALLIVSREAQPMVDWISRVALRWSEMAAALDRGDRNRMSGFFERTVATLRMFGEVLANLWGTLMNIGRAGTQVGNQLWESFRKVTQQWEDWTGSIKGQNALRDWFDRARPVLMSFFRLMGSLLGAFAGMAGDSETQLDDLFDQLRERLVPAISNLAKGLDKAFTPALIDTLVGVVNVFEDLGGVHGGLTAFLRVFQGLLDGLDWLMENFPGLSSILPWFFVLQGTLKAMSFAGAVTGLRGLTNALLGFQAVAAQRGIVGFIQGIRVAEVTSVSFAYKAGAAFRNFFANLRGTFGWLRAGGVGAFQALGAVLRSVVTDVTSLGASILRWLMSPMGAITSAVTVLAGAWMISKNAAESFNRAVEEQIQLLRSGTQTTTQYIQDLQAQIDAFMETTRGGAAQGFATSGASWFDRAMGWIGFGDQDLIEQGDKIRAAQKALLDFEEQVRTRFATMRREGELDEGELVAIEAAIRNEDFVEAFQLLQDAASDAMDASLDYYRELRSEARGVTLTNKQVADSFRRVQDAVRQARAERRQTAEDARRANEALLAANEAVADAVEKVSDAEEALADAQYNAKEAQEALTDAREDARRTLRDLRVEVERQWMSEREAILGLHEARKNLQDVMDDPEATWNDRQQALNAVTQAEWGLADVRKENRRRQRELNEAEEKGIEGADGVVDARRRLKDAIEGVSDAVTALTDSQEDVVKANEALAQAQENAGRANRKLARSIARQTEMFRRIVRENLPKRIVNALEDMGAKGERILDRLAGANEKQFARIMRQNGFLRADMKDTTTTIVGTLLNAARNGITNLGQVWGNIRKVFTDPVNQVQEQVLQPFLKRLKKLSGKFGQDIDLPEFTPIPEPRGGGKVPLMHTGGVVGRDETYRRRKRLRSDEQWTVLQKGERVIPRGEGPGAAAQNAGTTYKSIIGWLRRTGIPFRVSSTNEYRGTGTYHDQGKAVDFTGPSGGSDTPELLRINRAFARVSRFMTELIYSGPGGINLWHGQPHTYSADTQADHHDHVHVASLWNLLTGGIAKLAKGAGGSLFGLARGGGEFGNLAKFLLRRTSGVAQGGGLMGGLFAAAARRIGRQGLNNIGMYNFDAPNAPKDTRSVVRMVKSLAAQKYGWTGNEWDALYRLVSNESGFNPNAQNPSSSAYGLFQFLDSTWATVGGRKTSNPFIQAALGLKYVRQRYGTPSNALSFWMSQSPHWYAKGGRVRGTDTVPAWLTPGEFVLNRKATQQIGTANLYALNSAFGGASGMTAGSFLKGLAMGGYVSPAMSRMTHERVSRLDSSLGTDGIAAGPSGGVTDLTILTDGEGLHRTVRLHEGRNRVRLSGRD